MFVSYRHIQRVFQGNSSFFIKKLFIAYCTHMTLLLASLLYMACRPSRITTRRLRLYGEANIHKALKREKGVIMVCGHTGDWENSLNTLSTYLQRYKITISCIRKKLRLPMLEAIVFPSARRHGIEIIFHNTSSLRQILKNLQKNKLVIFVADQKPKPYEAKTRVFFMGHCVDTYTSLEWLVAKTHASVIVTYCYQQGLFRKTSGFFCPISNMPIEESFAQNYMTMLENFILCYPSQWIWSYRWQTHT